MAFLWTRHPRAPKPDLTCLTKFGLNWQGNSRDGTSGDLFYVHPLQMQEISLCHFAWPDPWVPSMLSQLEAKAPLEFCVGALPALEILLSLMSCSGFWYLSTSVALPPLTAWTDLAKYLRGWCSSHGMILITLQLYITWKEGVFNVWYCPQSTLRNYKIIIQAFKFPCHQCVCIVSRMK